MTEDGLSGVSNPSAIFLASYRDDNPRVHRVLVTEGSRPLLVEIQALVDTHTASPQTPHRRPPEQTASPCCSPSSTATAASPASTKTVFLNAVGGVKSANPPPTLPSSRHALQLPAAARCPKKWSPSGEIGLSGEVRRNRA